jgi:hypothetical protein
MLEQLINWRAPETFPTKKNNFKSVCDSKSDIYSLIYFVIHEICERKIPYEGIDIQKKIKNLILFYQIKNLL